MISWTTILYGAALSAILAAAIVAVAARRQRLSAGLGAAIGAAAGPIAWNAMLRSTHASSFFTDAPIAVMPASWQDTGSGVFALAATALILSLGPLRTEPARFAIMLSLLAGAVAFLVDVYLY
jgi:hypothetical protein